MMWERAVEHLKDSGSPPASPKTSCPARLWPLNADVDKDGVNDLLVALNGQLGARSGADGALLWSVDVSSEGEQLCVHDALRLAETITLASKGDAGWVLLTAELADGAVSSRNRITGNFEPENARLINTGSAVEFVGLESDGAGIQVPPPPLPFSPPPDSPVWGKAGVSVRWATGFPSPLACDSLF